MCNFIKINTIDGQVHDLIWQWISKTLQIKDITRNALEQNKIASEKKKESFKII